MREAKIESNIEKPGELLAAAEAGCRALLLEMKKEVGTQRDDNNYMTPWKRLEFILIF